MEFLKAILGDELYQQVAEKINAFNGDEANKDKQIKLADLGSGEYVSKGKYSTLEAENQTNATKLSEANTLIAQLQKATKGDGTVSDLKTRIKSLQDQIKQVQIDTAIQSAFIQSKVTDPDFLKFKLLQNWENPELDDNGVLKGLDERMKNLHTQFPKCFASGGMRGVFDGFKPDVPNYPYNDMTKTDILRMPYRKRVAFFTENPERYRAVMTRN